MTPERLSQIQALYHSARECELNRRTAFLAEACTGDEDLRGEVESLLAADPSGGCFLDEPVMQQAAEILPNVRSSAANRGALARRTPRLVTARITASPKPWKARHGHASSPTNRPIWLNARSLLAASFVAMWMHFGRHANNGPTVN